MQLQSLFSVFLKSVLFFFSLKFSYSAPSDSLRFNDIIALFRSEMIKKSVHRFSFIHSLSTLVLNVFSSTLFPLSLTNSLSISLPTIAYFLPLFFSPLYPFFTLYLSSSRLSHSLSIHSIVSYSLFVFHFVFYRSLCHS